MHGDTVLRMGLVENDMHFYIYSHSSGQVSEEIPANQTSLSTSMAEVGEDVPDDGGQPSLEESLTRLGLEKLTETFQDEQIDFDTLVSE